MSNLSQNNEKHISFEVFPPKKDGNFLIATEVIKEISKLSPDFISVTYGAGGSQSKKTLEIASYIENELHITAVAHLTCIGSTKEEIYKRCKEFKERNVSKILALRGDRPKDMTDERYNHREFIYASDLIKFIKEKFDLSIIGACYPEKHFEALSLDDDLKYMRQKQDLGVESFISQLFFDNTYFYNFMEKARKVGIKASVHAGIMPVTSVKQIGTTVSLSGSSVPKKLSDLIAKYSDKPSDMYKAGIDYSINQIRDLLKNCVREIHIYTMNKPDVAKAIIEGIQ